MPSSTSLQKHSRHYTLLPIAAIMTAVLFWGVSFVGMRLVLRELSPMATMWCRLITAFAVILPFFRSLIPDNYMKGDWKLLLPMVLFQPCLYFLLETNALMLTTSTQAGVISASVPVFVAIGARFFFHESMRRGTIAGLALSIAGVVFLTLSQGAGGSAENPVLGNIMELGAMIFVAGNILLVKKLSGRYSPWTLTAMQITAGVIFFTPGLFQLIKTDPAIWSVRLVLALLFLGAFVSFGAFALYNWGISKLTASKASTFINLVPVIAIITGWMFLGEGLTPIQLLATVGVIAGVMLSQRAVKE
jgi:drug/metabolite transporter (DMT)-like permease